MDKETVIYSCFMLFGSFISAVSQVLLKKSASRNHDSVITEYLNPEVIIAYSIFIIATLCTTMAYKVIPLSMGSILEASGYIYVTIMGRKIFNENVSSGKVVSLILIIAGITLFSIG